MKIIVLGGAGDMASRAVRDLANQPDVTTLTIADFNLPAARALKEELDGAGKQIVVQWVDANDHASLLQAIRGHEVVASGVGPFYRFEARVARAAIEAGAHYVSLCDDYDAAAAVLELDARAREKGVTVLTGLGWTPGLSNVLARKGAATFDQVDEINVAWGSSASDSNGYAVILHTLHIFTGLVPTFQRGQTRLVPAGSGPERVRFPEPVGEISVYHLGHPEPVTLPRFLPGLKTVTLKGGLSEQFLNDLGIWLARLRLTDTPEKKDFLGHLIKALLPYLSQIGQPTEPCSAVRVDVSGWRAGAYGTVSYGAAAHMCDLTGLPLAVGALMLGRGEIDRPGVVAPEVCVPVEPFLAALAARGLRVQPMAFEPPAVQPAPDRGKWLLAAAGLFLLGWLLGRRSGRR